MAENGRVNPRLRERYLQEIRPALRQEFNYPNVMAVPKIEKVVLNIGIGEAIQNSKALDAAAADLATISGQKAWVRKAKKSIAAFAP